MKKIILLTFFVGVLLSNIRSQRQLAPDSYYESYEDQKSAIFDLKSPWLIQLNSNWKYLNVSSLNEIDQSFFKKEFDDSGWSSLKLPSEAGSGISKVVFYRKYFPLPEIFYGREIFLHLKDKENLYSIWLNGRSLSFDKDSIDKSEVCITSFVKFGGINILNIVYKSDVGTIGLHNNVFLHSLPPLYFKKISVDYSFSSDKSMLVKLNGEIVNSHIVDKIKGEIGIGLYTNKGEKIYYSKNLGKINIDKASVKKFAFECSIANDTVFKKKENLKLVFFLNDNRSNELYVTEKIR